MTIWCVCNRPDQPPTIKSKPAATPFATATRTVAPKDNSLAVEAVKTTTLLSLFGAPSSKRPSTRTHQLSFVERQRMHSIAFKLSQRWQLLVFAIFINVISQTTSTGINSDSTLKSATFAINSNANFAPSSITTSNNGASGSGFGFNLATKASSTAATSTWPSNFFDSDRIQCPSFTDNSACPCYKFEDGNFIFVHFNIYTVRIH